jgi:SSS family solute:Na+ symporter
MAIPAMLARYYPAGLLGLGLTALLASFMSGMAGNVTAFNTVWTYDLYQGHINPRASDHHYLWMGRVATVAGIALSVATAYIAMRFNNIMDMLQLVFSFVNAPLLATFLLGMFWRRTTGDGAFWGLLTGTLAAALHYELTTVAGAHSMLPKIAEIHAYPSDMAQNFWGAIWAWTTCFVLTITISLATRPRPADELRGLVFGLTPTPEHGHEPWYRRPAVLAVVVLACTVALNLLFW